jgi:phage terminase small subunit
VLTSKQEKFAQTYVETGNASEAYRQAYSTKGKSENFVGVEASRLLSHPNISLRIDALKEEHRERHRVTVDDLLQELEEARATAQTSEKPQTAAMVSATMGKARILGLDKQVVEHEAADVNVVINRPDGD